MAQLRLLVVASLLALSFPAFADICEDVEGIASGWDELATAIDGALAQQLSDQDVEEMDSTIDTALKATRGFAAALAEAPGLKKWHRQMTPSLNAIENAEDFDRVIQEIGGLVATLDAMVAECAASREEPAGPQIAGRQPNRLHPNLQQPGSPQRQQPQPVAPAPPQDDMVPLGGSFRFYYQPAPTADLAELATILQSEGIYESFGAAIHSSIHLPIDIPVVFQACGQPNAFYNSQERKVIMCYEFFEFFAESLAGAVPEEQFGEAILGVGGFFLLHEFGHALVDVLELPITGREEDAVDQLAALIMIGADEVGESALLSTVTQFESSAAMLESQSAELPFWDEHSLNAQRMFDVACLLYGSNPEAYAGMVGPEGLPAERAARCPAEFQQKDTAWNRLLEPYMVADAE